MPTATSRLISALGLVLAAAGVASAQTSVFGLKIEGDVELGGRIYADRPAKEARAKLEEYRDLSEQPFGAFRLRLFRPDESYSSELGGAKIGQEDQEFFLFTGRPGLWNFGFEWDQTPHVFSTNGRLLATEPSPGVFTLPTPRPPLAAHNAGRALDEISTRWDTARFSFTLTPTPDLDLNVQYTMIQKNGQRPFGVGMGSPGNNFYEVLEPIDQTIHDFRMRGSWSGDWWQFQAGYTLSIFENGHTAVTADNPCFGASSGCGTDVTGAPERGRVSLAPDNMAHTVSLAGGVNLPMRTRVTANLSYSLRLQDEPFLPHTINPSLQSDTALTLPANSLGGLTGTFLFNVNATTRPLPPLTLSGRYRLFDLDDMRDELIFPGHVVNDRAPVVNEPRRTPRFEYTKQNADVDARWRFGAPLAATLGAGWERWDRNEHREVPTSDEYSAKATVDATPFDWLLARLTYRPSFRRISEYNPFAHPEHTVIEEQTPDEQAQGQSVLLRKFDEGERDRQRVDLLLQFTPTDVITITPTASYRHDDYIDSALGLQKAENWSAGFDVSWTPVEWLSAGAGYVYERIDQKMRSRNREVVGTTTLDFPDFDWISDNVDTIHTLHAGITATLIPKVLHWVLDVSYSKATGEVNTRNPVRPTSGTAAQQANATARPWPDMNDSLLRIETAFRYHFWKAWTASLGYIYEKFDKDDFRTDGLNPFVPGVNSIYLGNDLKDYTAHILVLTLGYRFQ